MIYADLALFLLDTRDGITFNDVALYKWLTQAIDRQNLIKERVSKAKKKADGVAEVSEASVIENDDLVKLLKDTTQGGSTFPKADQEANFGKITPGILPGLNLLISEKQKKVA